MLFRRHLRQYIMYCSVSHFSKFKPFRKISTYAPVIWPPPIFFMFLLECSERHTWTSLYNWWEEHSSVRFYQMPRPLVDLEYLFRQFNCWSNKEGMRCLFFAYGAFCAFQGNLNPHSGMESCVMPVLLYNCENWLLTDGRLDKLERFQAEIGRRIMRLSPFHSSCAVWLPLDLPMIAASNKIDNKEAELPA